jgi:hypothetical protein
MDLPSQKLQQELLLENLIHFNHALRRLPFGAWKPRQAEKPTEAANFFMNVNHALRRMPSGAWKSRQAAKSTEAADFLNVELFMPSPQTIGLHSHETLAHTDRCVWRMQMRGLQFILNVNATKKFPELRHVYPWRLQKGKVNAKSFTYEYRSIFLAGSAKILQVLQKKKSVVNHS